MHRGRIIRGNSSSSSRSSSSSSRSSSKISFQSVCIGVGKFGEIAAGVAAAAGSRQTEREQCHTNGSRPVEDAIAESSAVAAAETMRAAGAAKTAEAAAVGSRGWSSSSSSEKSENINNETAS